jgi:hypothetical protein
MRCVFADEVCLCEGSPQDDRGNPDLYAETASLHSQRQMKKSLDNLVEAFLFVCYNKIVKEFFSEVTFRKEKYESFEAQIKLDELQK